MSAVKRFVTLDDVASAAGVSRATVSRVINETKFVEPQVADRVRVAIKQLGYVPNHAARALSTRRTDMVALVATEPQARFFHDPFFADIVQGVSKELGDVDMRMLMALIQTPEELGRFQNYLLGRPVDGVLVISEHTALQIAPSMATAGIPIVLGGRPMDGAWSDIAHVDHDNRRGARLAAEHLIHRGSRKIATIAGPPDMSAGIDRLHGFRDAFPGPVAPELVATGDFSAAGGASAMEKLLDQAPDLDAVFAASDLMALGAMQTLRRLGKRVPDDVAVVGFDDIELGATAETPLTTIRQETVTQGRMMVRLLLRLLGRTPDLGTAGRATLPPGPSMMLPVTLVTRASA
ncbi:LacI family DNA-binding transcriptional regulator [Tessaracoccus antarcticus]|uniref:LacI family transcriptional regulator n=1 Tax=Tessaracoccus antarcticus TaxID=2479848 RepID=A0A3M0GAR2_9ACTN|nr:LacI family DNA-binding transcriptional regulator [Tessaracoccus antarcticus]RMB61518.1 LacI family transcriptional regulator [Tessaracoccus antarcticus]